MKIRGVLCGLLLWGCYPDGPTCTEDLDIVITHHNPNYDFVAKDTYAMPDKIVKIPGALKVGRPSGIYRRYLCFQDTPENC